MMSYFREGVPRDISLERLYVVRDESGTIIGYGGSIATAVMAADRDVSWEEARALELLLIEESRERRY